MENNIRLILCRNCIDWQQCPNPEQGMCKINNDNVTNYDCRCLLGLYENVNVPSIETCKCQKEF